MDKMSKKVYKISGRYSGAVGGGKENGESRANVRALRGVVGVALIVLAAVFGGLLSLVSSGAAFVLVFAYISAQLLIWLK